MQQRAQRHRARARRAGRRRGGEPGQLVPERRGRGEQGLGDRVATRSRDPTVPTRSGGVTSAVTNPGSGEAERSRSPRARPGAPRPAVPAAHAGPRRASGGTSQSPDATVPGGGGSSGTPRDAAATGVRRRSRSSAAGVPSWPVRPVRSRRRRGGTGSSTRTPQTRRLPGSRSTARSPYLSGSGRSRRAARSPARAGASAYRGAPTRRAARAASGGRHRR